jgi:hypothetical protein
MPRPLHDHETSQSCSVNDLGKVLDPDLAKLASVTFPDAYAVLRVNQNNNRPTSGCPRNTAEVGAATELPNRNMFDSSLNGRV